MAEPKKQDTKPVPVSEKTAGLKATLAALSIKNAQAMKLLDEKYAVKNDLGRKKRDVAPAYATRGLAQLGSSVGKMPEGYQRPNK